MEKPIRILVFLCCTLFSWNGAWAQRIAIISDPHIQDVVGHPELVRTWESQARSTRLFNENYFAFLAALDDVAQRDIKLVVLSGDLTDNGQQLTCQAVTRILSGYEQQYGMRFFMTTGNHDPNYPVLSHWGQKDFLGADGRPRVIYSDSCQFFLPNKPQEILTPDTVVPSLRCLGYPELIDEWHDFGFLPHEGDLYWEHPDNPTPYPDASYLVEPEPGLWLLSIDGSVHTLKESSSFSNQTPLLGRGGGRPPYPYNGSWPGYNNVMTYKPFLVDWVRSVVRRSQEQGKRLVVFSHYPLLDFNNGATDIVREAWGEKAFDLTRVPKPEVAEAFYEAGVRLHIAGHMHVNQTGIYHHEGTRGASLVNVQVPSVAGYMPAYKILTIENDSIYDFQTVRIDSVPGYDTFFALSYPRTLAPPKTDTVSYLSFCSQWFSELVANRFVKQDLPKQLQDYLPQMGGTYADASSPSGEATWTGLDLITDLYRLRFAGSLALSDIPQARLQAYEDFFSRCEGEEDHPCGGERGAKGEISVLAEVFHCMLNGLPDNHFRVNVRTGELLH